MSLLPESTRLLGVGRDGVVTLVAITVLLAAGTVLRGWKLRRHPDREDVREEWRSLGTWWVLFVVLVVVLLAGRWGVVAAMTILSLLLFRETLALTDSTLGAALVAVLGPSFTAAAAFLPAPDARAPAGLGWFLFLVLVTELNDISQKWWGSALGSRPLAPVLSPFKTWEGLWGGVVTTVVASLFLAPLLTPWGHPLPPELLLTAPPWVWSAGLGLALALAGTVGDLGASALKRRAGVKDAGTLLPGHGGLLDRFDSLNGTAPVFVLASWLLWSSS